MAPGRQRKLHAPSAAHGLLKYISVPNPSNKFLWKNISMNYWLPVWYNYVVKHNSFKSLIFSLRNTSSSRDMSYYQNATDSYNACITHLMHAWASWLWCEISTQNYLPLNFSISTVVLASSGRKELAGSDLIVESVISAGSTGSDFACDNQISQLAVLIKFILPYPLCGKVVNDY